jgi:hypothetical protein
MCGTFARSLLKPWSGIVYVTHHLKLLLLLLRRYKHLADPEVQGCGHVRLML